MWVSVNFVVAGFEFLTAFFMRFRSSGIQCCAPGRVLTFSSHLHGLLDSWRWKHHVPQNSPNVTVSSKNGQINIMQKFLMKFWRVAFESFTISALYYWLTAQTLIGKVKEHIGMVEKACLKLSLLNFGLHCWTILLSLPHQIKSFADISYIG